MQFDSDPQISSNGVSTSERGSTEALLVLVPTCLLVVTLFALIQYGAAANYLASSSTLIGRQLARNPEVYDLERLALEEVQQNKITVSDFHVMRIPLGKKIFIQTILVGRKINFGPFSVAPYGRSLTLVDSWS
jgi:hypothetical protein